MTSPQIALDLTLQDDATFDNFLPGKNMPVIAALKQGLSGTGESFIYLWGMQGVGRSHLLYACCHEMNESRSAVYLDLKEYKDFSPDVLEGLEKIDLICLDNINAVLIDAKWEKALFSFYNRVREGEKILIVVGNISPIQLNCSLKDLRSRLAWGLSFHVKSLDDAQKLIALKTRAKNRGIVLPESVAQYLLHHTSRNLSELFEILTLLEKKTLVEQRRMTIPFVKAVLS